VPTLNLVTQCAGSATLAQELGSLMQRTCGRRSALLFLVTSAGVVIVKRDGERSSTCVPVRPNVRAKPTAEAGAGWPRKDDIHSGLKRPDGGCRSGSAP